MTIDDDHGSHEGADDDLRSVLAAAVAEHSTSTAPTDDASELTTAQERARDAAGRFAPKPGDDPAPGTATETPSSATPDGTAPAATPKVPAAWSKETQAQFGTLPPAIQAEILKREADVAKGFNERAERVRFADEFERVATPYRETFAKHGLTPLQGAERMFAVEKALERDPVGTIRQIAAAYRVDPRALIGASPQQAAPGAPAPVAPQTARDPRVDRLEQYIASQQRSEQQRQAETVQAEISRFAADPANKHFDALRSQMSQLIRSGQAADIPTAYKLACRLDDAIHEQIIAERTAPAAQQAKAAKDQAAASRARGAAVSVTGSPTGAVRAKADGGDGSIRGAIRAAMAEQA